MLIHEQSKSTTLSDSPSLLHALYLLNKTFESSANMKATIISMVMALCSLCYAAPYTDFGWQDGEYTPVCGQLTAACCNGDSDAEGTVINAV